MGKYQVYLKLKDIKPIGNVMENQMKSKSMTM